MGRRGRPKKVNINAIDKKELTADIEEVEEKESRKETPLQKLRRKARENKNREI